MNFNFILDLVIMLSLGTVLFLIARVLPRINDEEYEPELKTSLVLVCLEKADVRVKMFTEKFLRRTRVVIMKFDNSLSERLRSFKKDSDKNGGLSLVIGEKKEKEEQEQ